MAWRVVRYQEVSINDTRGRKTTSSTGRRSLAVPMVLCCTQWRFRGGGGPGGGGRGDHPPLVAENVVCSNSNFSPTGAITPDHPPPLWPSPPPSENPVSAPVYPTEMYLGYGRLEVPMTPYSIM